MKINGAIRFIIFAAQSKQSGEKTSSDQKEQLKIHLDLRTPQILFVRGSLEQLEISLESESETKFICCKSKRVAARLLRRM